MSEENLNIIRDPEDNNQETAAPVDDFATTAEELVVEAPVEAEAAEAEPIDISSNSAEPITEPIGYTPPVQNTAPQNQYNPYSSQPYTQQQNTNYYNYSAAYNAGMYGNAPQTPPAPQKKKKKGLMIFFIILAAVVFFGLIFGGVSFVVKNVIRNVNPSLIEAQTQVMEELPSANAPVLDITPSSGKVLTPTEIAAKVKPSVVAVIAYSNNSGGIASEGSGVLWKEEGEYTYLVTCAHVINGSGYSYTIQVEDGTQYDAEYVGGDAKTDLGVLKIKATGLSLAEFGDSSALRVGDPVYAIGNPGGTEFFGSFTDGVVSAIDRSVKSTYTMICIQHTAAINPGNSGGALVNAYGQVIGINSLKIIDTEYEGMGFAIPIKSAQPIINNLAAYGYVPNRPKLGITYMEAINYQQYSMIIKIKGLPSGALIINEINEDSGLANTEARQYDMIIAVDGEDMTTPDVLLDRIENGKVGEKLTLTICRIDNNYQITEFDVTATLVEEKKTKDTEETTTAPTMIDPFDYFNGMFW